MKIRISEIRRIIRHALLEEIQLDEVETGKALWKQHIDEILYYSIELLGLGDEDGYIEEAFHDGERSQLDVKQISSMKKTIMMLSSIILASKAWNEFKADPESFIDLDAYPMAFVDPDDPDQDDTKSIADMEKKPEQLITQFRAVTVQKVAKFITACLNHRVKELKDTSIMDRQKLRKEFVHNKSLDWNTIVDDCAKAVAFANPGDWYGEVYSVFMHFVDDTSTYTPEQLLQLQKEVDASDLLLRRAIKNSPSWRAYQSTKKKKLLSEADFLEMLSKIAKTALKSLVNHQAQDWNAYDKDWEPKHFPEDIEFRKKRDAWKNDEN